jgi:hypothetical protein
MDRYEDRNYWSDEPPTLSERELLEWAAGISPRAEAELRRLQWAEKEAADEARRDRELLEFMASFSEKHELVLRNLLRKEAEEREQLRRLNEDQVAEAKWLEDDHPRQPKGTPEGGEWVKKGGGGATSAGSAAGPEAGSIQTLGYHPAQASVQFVGTGNPSGQGKPTSFLDAVIKRNQTIADLTGVVTPGMIRSNRVAAELQSAQRLPGDVARAAAAGLGTGGKAVVNGVATAVKGVATLGLNTSQLELIGVTKEDRERGYDTAVSIATGSGQVLIAVGTGGIASALSKGGSIAQAANGALIAYDAAGNAVGVVQGVYDASKNGVSVHNGAQIAGGLLGLGANAKAMTDLGRAVAARRLKEIDDYVATLPRRATPKSSAANQYEIKHTGPYNYTISGGGESFAIDGYRGSTILEAKHVGKTNSSPYVPGSSAHEKVRAKVLNDSREELRRIRVIIESGTTPFKSVEIITNSPEAKKLFEGLLKESRVPGTVRLEP